MTRHFFLYLAAVICFVVAVVLDVTEEAKFLMSWAGWTAAGLTLATLPKLFNDKPL